MTAAGVTTVLDLLRLDTVMVKSRWSVVLERTVRELQEMPCIDLDHSPAPKKEITCIAPLWEQLCVSLHTPDHHKQFTHLASNTFTVK